MKRTTIRIFTQDVQGQDAVEYALLTGFLCLACAAILATLVTHLRAVWTFLNGLLSNPG